MITYISSFTYDMMISGATYSTLQTTRHTHLSAPARPSHTRPPQSPSSARAPWWSPTQSRESIVCVCGVFRVFWVVVSGELSLAIIIVCGAGGGTSIYICNMYIYNNIYIIYEKGHLRIVHIPAVQASYARTTTSSLSGLKKAAARSALWASFTKSSSLGSCGAISSAICSSWWWWW
jgi:hypothetical protein